MEVKAREWLLIGLVVFSVVFCGTLTTCETAQAEDNDGITEPDVVHYDNSQTQGLSETVKDLFYIPTFGNPSLLDGDNQAIILQHIAEPVNPGGLGGLGYAVHSISFGQANATPGEEYRRISDDPTDGAYAINLKEDSTSPLRVNGVKQVLGSVPNHGTPKTVDWGEIFTKRIEDLLKEECNNKPIDEITESDCLDNSNPPLTGRDLFNRFVFHVFTHEAGHMLGPLATDLPPYYHTDDRKNPTVMDQAVGYKYSKKDGNTLFTIVNLFRPEDAAATQSAP